MNSQEKYATLGIDIGSTTVKIAILDENHNILFSDYERHFANIRETLSGLLKKAYDQLGRITAAPHDHRLRRTDVSQSLRGTFYPGGRSCGYLPAGAGSQDRRSH